MRSSCRARSSSSAFAREHKAERADGAFDAALHKAIAAAVERANLTLPIAERVRRFTIAHEPFSIENGQMTPTLKIKRHAIRQVYDEVLAALYEARG